MMEESQKSAIEKFQDKFISVVEPIVVSGDSNNIEALLSSLTNICKEEPDIIVLSSQESTSDPKTIEFSCWLISQLLRIKSNEVVEDTVTDLVSNIFITISIKNCNLYVEYLKDILHLAKDATSLLYEGESLSHQCFHSLVDINIATLKPKVLHLETDDENLDGLLIKIIKILGKMAHQTLLFAYNYLNDVWFIIGQSIEAGGIPLKVAALDVTSSMLFKCGLPFDVELQDYIVSLLGGCCVSAIKGELGRYSCDNTGEIHSYQKFEQSLSAAMCQLNKQKSFLASCLHIDIIAFAEQFLMQNHSFSCISGKSINSI